MNAASAAVLLAGLAGLLTGDERPVAAARLHRLRQGAERARPADGPAAGHRSGLLAGAELSSWVARAVAAVAAALLVTGRAGAALVLVVVALWLGVPPARRRRQAAAARAVVDRDLPRAADLTATCLEAGAAPADALVAVADAIGGPVGMRLRAVSLAVRAGADLPEAVGPLAVCFLPAFVLVGVVPVVVGVARTLLVGWS